MSSLLHPLPARSMPWPCPRYGAGGYDMTHGGSPPPRDSRQPRACRTLQDIVDRVMLDPIS